MHYSFTAHGTTTHFWSLGEARASAQDLALNDAMEVEVTDDNGAVAFVATPVVGRIFYPFERVETPKFKAPALEGFRTAYTRRRIEATVYRALDLTGWLVHDGRTDGRTFVRTTKQACKVTKEMGQGRLL